MRIWLKGSSDYQIVTDREILSGYTPAELVANLVQPSGTGKTNITCLRIWAEGYSNASSEFDNIQFKESVDLGLREEQPHKVIEGERPLCKYDLTYYNDNESEWQASDYYARLTSIVDAAEQQDVIVLFTLFDGCLKNFEPYFTIMLGTRIGTIKRAHGFQSTIPYFLNSTTYSQTHTIRI